MVWDGWNEADTYHFGEATYNRGTLGINVLSVSGRKQLNF